MDLRKEIVFGSCLFVMVSLLCSMESRKSLLYDTKQKKIPAPDFILQDTTGKMHKLSDYKGKVVLLEFFATWCPPCREKIPQLNKLHNTYKNTNLIILAVNIQESKPKLEQFIKANSIKYTVLLDSDAKIASIYEVRGIPTVVLVDKKGNIRYSEHILPDNNIIKQLISEN